MKGIVISFAVKIGPSRGPHLIPMSGIFDFMTFFRRFGPAAKVQNEC